MEKKFRKSSKVNAGRSKKGRAMYSRMLSSLDGGPMKAKPRPRPRTDHAHPPLPSLAELDERDIEMGNDARDMDFGGGGFDVTVPTDREEGVHGQNMEEGNDDVEGNGSEDENEDSECGEEGQEGISPWDLLGESFQRTAVLIDGKDFSENELAQLRIFATKIRHNIPFAAYEDIRASLPSARLDSLKEARRNVQNLSGLKPVIYHCCAQSCMCYTGTHADLQQCVHCKSPRFKSDGVTPSSQFEYLPITNRLRTMLASPYCAREMRYRAHEHEHDPSKVTDVFDCAHYLRLKKTSVTVADEVLPHTFFSDPRDVAFGFSTDGFTLFKHRKATAWPLILFNYNLPPETRFQKQNVICLGVIPGPSKPLDCDSFLWPMVQEMLELARGVTAFDALTGLTFVVHAYLILVFGDIPAVSMVMRMKGQNGKSPCRMCSIPGIRTKGGKTNYVPLNRSRFAPPGSQNIDPSQLPHRTHDEFIRQATEVKNAQTKAEAARLAKEYGIKGIPLLCALKSLSFPDSFVFDFMHLIWENLIPNLVRFWTGKFKKLDHSDEGYVISDLNWSRIGAASAASGDTIPAAFGSRTPNIADQKYQFKAENWSNWTLFLAPILLRGRFPQEKFHKHFVQLVKLLDWCIDYEMPSSRIDQIEEGFKRWVQDYEKLYYQHDPSRVSACPLTIHALLHVASGIRNIGPVWATWTYPTERFCGDITPAIGSRRFPYSSINNYVTAVAQLDNIKKIYNLHEELKPVATARKEPTSEERKHYFEPYSEFILSSPKKKTPLDKKHWRAAETALATRFGVGLGRLRKVFPVRPMVAQFHRVSRVDGGDTIQCCPLDQLGSNRRDASFVRFELLVDKHATKRKREPEFEEKVFYGRLLYVFILEVPKFHKTDRETLALAVIRRIGDPEVCNGFTRYKNMGALVVVDLKTVQRLVGRVYDRSSWAIIDRTGPENEEVVV